MQNRENKKVSECGAGKFTILFFATIFAVVVYSAYKVIPFFYCYLELKNQMEAAIRVGQSNTDDEIRQKILYHIKKLEIPMASPEDLLIERSLDRMKITLGYEEVFYITIGDKDYDIHTFPFLAQAEGQMSESTGKW